MKKTIVILSMLAALVPSIAHAAPAAPDQGAGVGFLCRKISNANGTVWVCAPFWRR